MTRQLLLRSRDRLIEQRAARVAAAFALEPVLALGAVYQQEGEPVGLLVELELDGALEAIRQWRARDPELAIAAYLSAPAPELWKEAELAGADQVTTRGRAHLALHVCLEDRLSGRRRARRLRLPALADFAGRLGYVGRIGESPVGPIALFHLSGRVWAISDVCPHAGASLCEGELDGEILTCPRHGSQFRVSDGERVRGPADRGVQTFPVIVDSGEAFVELPAASAAAPEAAPADGHSSRGDFPT
jgi:nitrite reductase/ring-hydroxylating ferredoxin subunit